MNIRPATLADAPAMAELTTQLGYPTTAEQMRNRFAVIDAHTDYRTLLAENETGVVGLIALVKGLSWEHDELYIRVISLVVSSRARRQRAGERLIASAERWATETGAARLVLNCGNRPERAAAHEFYGRMGFAARSTGYQKRLTLLPDQHDQPIWP